MSKQIKSLLKPTDFVLTDGKAFIVVESAEEATKQQELMAYDKPDQPIYLLTLASVALLTKNDVKRIKKELKAKPVAIQDAANDC